MRSLANPLTALLFWLVLSPCPQGFTQEQPVEDAVDEAYGHGMELYAAGRFQEAAAAFKEAYSVANDPALLWNIARALEKAGELEEARDTYKDFLGHEDVHGDLRLKANEGLLRVELELRNEKTKGDGRTPEERRLDAERASRALQEVEVKRVQQFELGVDGGYRSALANGEAITNSSNLAGRFGWQEWGSSWIHLWLEGSLGMVWNEVATKADLTPSQLCEVDPTECPKDGTTSESGVWVLATQSVRFNFIKDEDTLSAGLGLGAYFAGSDENGAIVQARVDVYYLTLSALLSVGRSSGVALGGGAGLRYRF